MASHFARHLDYGAGLDLGSAKISFFAFPEKGLVPIFPRRR